MTEVILISLFCCTVERFVSLTQALRMGDGRERLKQLTSSQPVVQKSNLQQLEYTGPIRSAEIACKYFPTNREAVLVFDVCVGIGLNAIELKKKGFKIFDGYDTSPWMLEKATETRLYRKLQFCDPKDLEVDPVLVCVPFAPKATYDLVTTCGACERLPVNAIFHTIRMVKPGGIITIVNRRSTIYEDQDYVDNFFPKCEQFQAEGIWTKLEQTTYKGFLGNEDGLILAFRVN